MSLDISQEVGNIKLVLDRMIVSDGTGNGTVKIYKKILRTYILVQTLEPAVLGQGYNFGSTIYANGNFLVVHEDVPESGAYLRGKLYTYQWTGTNYTLRNQIRKTRTSVSEISFGEEYIVSSPNIIASVTYEDQTKDFYSLPFKALTEEELLPEIDYEIANSFEQVDFNMENVEMEVSPIVAISEDASTLVISKAFESDNNPGTIEYRKVHIYTKFGSNYTEEKVYTSSIGFGDIIDISQFGETIIISSPNETNFVNNTSVLNSGNLYVVNKEDNVWGDIIPLTHPGPIQNGKFANEACISGSGRVIYAYIPQSNEVVRYDKNINGNWILSTQRVQVEPVDLNIDNKTSLNTMFDGSRFTLGPKIYRFSDGALLTDLTTLGTETILDLNPNLISEGGSNLTSLFQPTERIIKVDGDYVVTVDNFTGVKESINMRVYKNTNGVYSNIFTRNFTQGITDIDMHNGTIIVGCGTQDTNPTTGVGAGFVYVFKESGGTFSELFSISGQGDGGSSNQTSPETLNSVEGYYYGGNYNLIPRRQKQPDNFGASVSIYNDVFAITSTKSVPVSPGGGYDHISQIWNGNYFKSAGSIHIYGIVNNSFISLYYAEGPLRQSITNTFPFFNITGVKLIDSGTAKLTVYTGPTNDYPIVNGETYDTGVYTLSSIGSFLDFDDDFSYLDGQVKSNSYSENNIRKYDIELLINGEYEKIITVDDPYSSSLYSTTTYFDITADNNLLLGFYNYGPNELTYQTYTVDLDNLVTKAQKGGNTSGVFMSSDGNVVTTALKRIKDSELLFRIYTFNFDNNSSTYNLSGSFEHITQNLNAKVNYNLINDGNKIITAVGEDNLTNSVYEYEFRNNNWQKRLLYSSNSGLTYEDEHALDAANDGTIITANKSDTSGTYTPFNITVLRNAIEEEEVDPDGAVIVDFGLQIYGTGDYPYTQKLQFNGNNLLINTFEYIQDTGNSYGKIYVLFWNGTEYITLQTIEPVIPEGKNIIFAKNFEVKGTKLIVTSLILDEDTSVPPRQTVSIYELIVGRFLLNETFETPNIVNEDYGYDLSIDNNRLIISANDEFADPDENNIYIKNQIITSPPSGPAEEEQGGEFTQIRIHLGLPYENVFDENGGIITDNLPDIRTPNFLGLIDGVLDTRALAVDYATENVVQITLTTKMTIYDIKLGNDVVGRMRVFNKAEPYIELILYVQGFGYDEGITEAKLREGLKLNVKYPSPNIRFKLNTMPRLHSVKFI